MTKTTGAASVSLIDEARLLDPDFYLDPHGTFARMRREAPVFYLEAADTFALTKLEDVQLATRASDIFSAQGPMFMTLHNDAPLSEEEDDPSNVTGSWFRTSPRVHSQFRRQLNVPFSIPSVAKLQTLVREVVCEVLDGVPDGEPIDVVKQVAETIPLCVVSGVLGVPREDRAQFVAWSKAQVESFATTPTLETAAAGESAKRQSTNYMIDAQRRRRANPTDDVISQIAHMEVLGHRLSEPAGAEVAFGLLLAGHDTTKNAATGGLLALHDYPQEWRRLQADPGLTATMADEIVRWFSPIIHFCRTAREDTEIRGQKIQRGQHVALMYSAANRDEEMWDQSDRFDIGRRPEPMHVGFGYGGHFCIGSHLARLDLRIIFEEVTRRFRSWEPLDVTRSASTVNNNFEGVTMVFHRR